MNALKPIRTEAQHRAALKETIRRLRDQLGIPANVLVGEPARGGSR